MSGFRVVIPSRFASQRLPAKALRSIAGKPLVVHVLERAMRSGAEEVIVATDDDRIRAAVEEAGGRAAMTSPDHASGTDRLWEIARERKWDDDAIVVNLQGDEPLVPPSMLDDVASALRDRESAAIATFATPIVDALTLFSPSVVKVVLDRDGFALYFSRAPIPWVRDRFVAARPNEGSLPDGVPFLRHLGLYAYRVRTLRAICAQKQASIEIAESLEQLRALALGMKIHVSICSEAPPPGVDTEEDLARVRAVLEA